MSAGPSGAADAAPEGKRTSADVAKAKPGGSAPADATTLTRLGQGFFWQDIQVGQRFRTYRRTITETDLVGFINVTGMLEAIFIDAQFSQESGAIGGRVVPAALTYCLIEGLLFQSMIQGTGLAMLELEQKAVAPVFVGDSVWATVEVSALRPTSKNNRAIVTSQIAVFNQHDELVLTYRAVRMLAGR
jgi:3-hydroxybutyryl-CoA dehydratase